MAKVFGFLIYFVGNFQSSTNPEIGMNDHIVYTTFLDELRMLAAKYTHLPIFLQQLSNWAYVLAIICTWVNSM